MSLAATAENVTQQPKLTPAMIERRKRALIRKFTLLQQMSSGRYASVSIQGKHAGTTGKTTVLPLGNFEDPEYLDMLEGMSDHESGHMEHTDFSVWYGIKPIPLLKTLTNIFEDIRIEALVGAKFAGAKTNLIRLVQIAIKRGLFSAPSNQDDLAVMVQKYILYTGRYKHLHQFALKEYADEAGFVLSQALPNAFPSIEAVVSNCSNALSTADALYYAEQILKILKQEVKDQQEEQQQEQQQNSQSPESEEDSDEEQQSEPGESGDTDESESGEDEENESESNGTESGDSNESEEESDENTDEKDGDQSGDSDGSDKNSDDDETDESSGSGGNSDEENEDKEGDQTGDSESESNSDENQAEDSSNSENSNDESADLNDDSPEGDDSEDSQSQDADNSNEYSLGVEEIEKALSAEEDDLLEDMHEAIAKAMEEKAEEYEEEYQEEHGEAYARPSLGFSNRKSPNTSGMPSWIPQAKSLSQRVKQVLYSIMYDRNRVKRNYDNTGTDLCASTLWGVKAGNSRVFKTETTSKSPNTAFSILVDKSGSMNGEEMVMANTAAFAIAQALEFIKGAACEVLYYPYADVNGAHNHVAKGFNERINAVQNHSFNVHADNGTPTAEAMQGATSSLALRKEPNKVMFLITDGATSGAGVKAALKECDILGITVIGIGIKTGVLAGFDNRPFFAIKSAQELSNALFTYLKTYYRG
ncbi:VWA domain-containing protein [Vibrio sp. 10N.261.46.E12]|uniref:cobaltochelatase CobT-related protein n=1 Tax=unclassified Vibrio TaxID=2614977 RepID=UPI0009779531|nr:MULTISPECIES: VWA domain-containing protein [unclassified Vibrio]OMO36209.1 hypothetical protein BH584_05380 [Vibrio sp. 10N.261.45.E1]PMJ34439.1 hypothetical protein BCU27_03155 [Vibrio sp. 10N.286.45.B6]PML86810.1 hypothetical protein BCT66_00860 [Vibrio sp. 10N.261.49.E11]PMM76810.1 hypothetical protein BCT48_24735 [Vibrio sp. 10N.261.46.F12]PMM81822.1 hypothetical protein BCT46_15560 [Vibrio sp. 10N.261.46.E8]